VGVVRSINFRKHSITVAVRSSKRGHHVRVMTFRFTPATVSGTKGIFTVGEKVKITSSDATSSGGDAGTITVIGTPNGGDSGNGAAISGTVTAVDPTSGTITLGIGDDGGSAQSVVVEVTSNTILAIPGSSGSPSINDIHVGDHAVVFTADVTASPIVALGVL